jgi:3-oxosteroid 1-dehydrogenase
MLGSVPHRWDMETDVVVVGSGIGGLAAAISAADNGAEAIVLERSGQVGGVTALSLGEVWVPGNHLAEDLGIEDSVDSGFRYVQRLAMGYAEDPLILNTFIHAKAALHYFEGAIGLKMRVIRDCPDYYYKHVPDAAAEGRLLEPEPFPAETLGEWQSRTRVSPLTPYGMTHEDMFGKGGVANMQQWDFELMGDRLMRDHRCLGSGLAAYFVKGALDRKVAMYTGFDVQQLIGEGERVAGVRAAREGDEPVFIKANRGVVLGVSSFERNREYNKTLASQLDLHSMLFPGIDGANFRLAGPAGARIARVPDITSLGYHIPGEEQEGGDELWRNAMQPLGLPHSITVNRRGQRFGNEAFYRDIYQKVDAIDGSSQTHPNFPCWLIMDSQSRAKYPFGSIMPGQDLPEELAVKADTIEELATNTGIDPEGLAHTVARFNDDASRGQDPEFGRGSHPWSAWMCGDPFNQPHPNLGTVSKAPFYAVELHRMGGSAIASAGIVADQHCRALGWDDKPIEGLYVVGNSVARLETGAMMQSGISNARGMAHGYLAGLHASGNPSPLLPQERARLQL